MIQTSMRNQSPLKRVAEFGQSLWYDGLLGPHEFSKMIREDGVCGATTNPTIFEKALTSGQYDAPIKTGLAAGRTVEEVYRELAVAAVRGVADAFFPVYRDTRGLDGYVSIEVSPLLAYQTEATLAEARELRRLVDKPNVMIKVPATKEGIPAVRALIREGINVNVTLIFSVKRYREVMDAYVSGLEDRVREAAPVDGIASVASFFVSRVDTAVDSRRPGPALAGKAAIANSKMAYREFERFFGGPRFQALAEKGARKQRPLWASTGTKNPAYSDVYYVEALIGPDTVDTMPPATMDAYRDHGKPASRLREGMPEAEKVLNGLEAAGIDLLGITQELETAGVQLFSDSYTKLLKGIEAKRG